MATTKCIKTDCFSNEKEVCGCLDDTNFKERECPFYKTKEQREKELAIYGDGSNYIGPKAARKSLTSRQAGRLDISL